MHKSYNHILTFTCKHQYFKDGLFKTIHFSFATPTLKLMNDLGIVIKPFIGGFHLISSNPELLEDTDEFGPLQLFFSSKDPFYVNYSELSDYNPSNNLLYFNNLNSFSKSKGYCLHSNEFVSDNDVVQLSHGSVRIPSFDSNKEYVFKEASNIEISNDCLIKSPNSPTDFSLTNLPQGLVCIFENKKEVRKVYYQPKSVWRKPMGTLEIFTGTLYNHFKEHGKIEYAVNFNNKQTIWKYFLTGSSYHKFKNLSIINKDKEPVFNPPEKIQVQEESAMLVFESKQQIPLEEFSENTLQLVDSFIPELRSGKVIIKNLKQASAEQLFQDAQPNNESNYSHIYIY